MRQQGKLDVGSKCFMKGVEYALVAFINKGEVLLQPLSNTGAAGWSVTRALFSDVQPLASEVFAIGDPIATYHTFRGIVVGFEPRENRVVCRSHRINEYDDVLGPGSGKRARWSYLPHEIFKVQNPVMQLVQLGETYTMTATADEAIVRAVPHPTEVNIYNLVDVVTGYVLRQAYTHATLNDLAREGVRLIPHDQA